MRKLRVETSSEFSGQHSAGMVTWTVSLTILHEHEDLAESISEAKYSIYAETR